MFLQYRDVAPETVDDTALRNLIKKHQGSRDGIAGALENIWRGNIVLFMEFLYLFASSVCIAMLWFLPSGPVTLFL
jgi:hypothetical protein